MVACVLLALTAIVYAPGLRSGFLLDDFYNLQPLKDVSTGGWASFVFGGPAGPSGRPLSMLSFAFQHSSWPQAPIHFKVVNLLLHLLNGVLVFLAGCRLAAGAGHSPRAAQALALIAGGLWLLHPMQMSTVLYVVQRMAELSTLFMLLGLLGWLHGRTLSADRPRAGYVLMTASILGGTVLATLAKENGVLLPLLILIADGTLLRNAARPAGYAAWRLVVLIIPALLPILYLLWTLPGASRSFADMPYSLWQKTITEGVVLVLYLKHLFIPTPGAFGLYHDGFPVSTGLFDPPITAVAVTAVFAAVAAAIGFRRKWPLASFGILWFFACHLLESTHLNLALYFEHRNYHAAIGIFLMLAGLAVPLTRDGSKHRTVWIGAGIAYALLVTAVTAQNSLLWRSDRLRAAEGVRTQPRSVWAHAELGNHYLVEGRHAEALALFREMESQALAVPYARLKQMAIVGCVQNADMGEAWWQQTMELAPTARGGGSEVLAELDRVISTLQAGGCTAVDTGRLLGWIEALAANGAFHRERGGLLELATLLALHRGEPDRALADLTAAAKASPTPNRRLQYIELLAAMGRVEEARTALDRLEEDWRARPRERLAFGDRVEMLRGRMQNPVDRRDRDP